MSARFVAIITDGNGRWAQGRGLSVAEGHQAGADTVKARLKDAVDLGIEELTVYSFSTENWSRSEEDFAALLYAPEMHDPDLLIRTSGEQRTSNFLPWQCAYSELVFTPTLWPDFSRADLEDALQQYEQRQRRFGGR